MSYLTNQQLRQAWRRERRDAAKHNSRAAAGLGFLAWGDDSYDLYEENYGWDGGDMWYFDGYGYNYGDFYYDPWADSYYGFDSGNLPIYPNPVSAQVLNDAWADWFASFSEPALSVYGARNPDLSFSQTGNPFLPAAPPTNDNNDPWLPDNFWDYLTGVFQQNDTYRDLQQTLDWWTQITNPNQALPKPCYGATYHPYPSGHPQQDLCVPYPPNDPNAKKKANQAQQAAQKAAQAARAAQQRKDQQCKDPQGRPVWNNPQTGRCELRPPCTTPGTKFDSTTGRCLTPQQIKELYGDNNWLWWLLGGGAALILLTRDSGGRRR